MVAAAAGGGEQEGCNSPSQAAKLTPPSLSSQQDFRVVNMPNPCVTAKVGYLDQESHLLPTATVMESLLFSAILRLPQKSMTMQHKIQRVADVMTCLKIEHIANNVIGKGKGREWWVVGHGQPLLGMHHLILLTGLQARTVPGACLVVKGVVLGWAWNSSPTQVWSPYLPHKKLRPNYSPSHFPWTSLLITFAIIRP